MSRFRFTHSVPVRFSDLDVLGHVNHIAYLEALETGRIAYYYQVLGFCSVHEIKFVLVHLRVRYLASAGLGQTLQILFRMAWLKRSSSGFAYEIRDEKTGDLLVEGDGVQVYMDLTTNESRPLPEGYRVRLADFEQSPLTPP